MSRKRMVSPEFYTDEKILELPIPARLMFIGIWNHADDEGVFKDSPKQLKAQIYPANEEITINTVIEYVKMMVNLKLLTKGTNIDKTSLLKITNFNVWQKINRPTPSKYVFTPLQITEDSLNDHGGLSERSVSDHGGLSEDSLPIEVKSKEDKLKEDNIKVKENSSKTKAQKIKDEFTFDRFYSLYPRKIKRDMAFNAYKVIAAKYLPDVYDGLDRYVKKWKAEGTNADFIPYPSTWLNQKQWTDDIVVNIQATQPKFKNDLDRQIHERNNNMVTETKRMTAYIKHADEIASDEVPDLNAMMKKESNAQPISEVIGQFMSQTQPDTSTDGE